MPPLALGWWIRRNRDNLLDDMPMRRFGFLYRGYRLDAFPWWGCVALLGKVAVSAIVVFIENELEQMVTALLVFVVLLVLQMAARPFKTAMLNNLQVLAYAALSMNQFVPIYISIRKTANQQDREQHLDSSEAVPVSVALIALNIAVALCYLVCAWRERGTAVAIGRAKAGKMCVALRRCCCGCGCCRSSSGSGGDTVVNRRGSLHEDLLGDMYLSDRSANVGGGGGGT